MAGVGVVGLGLLGSAVAGRLRAAGREVIGYDVVAERNRALEAIGGRAAASVAAVAEAADPICVVLPSLSAVEDVVHALAATARGRTVVQMSTISPALTERLARECAQRGVDFLDCPISGTSGMVARGDGIIFVGGEHAVYERWRPPVRASLPPPRPRRAARPPPPAAAGARRPRGPPRRRRIRCRGGAVRLCARRARRRTGAPAGA